MRRILSLASVGLVVGVALGLLIGWVLWPVQYTNTAPAQLRQDYRNDYVLMIAAAYQVQGDLEAARARLAFLGAETLARPVVDLAEQLIVEDGRVSDIEMLVHLADALGATTPSMAPYLEGQP
ncbi:MAG TPA: hypothetical protein ENI37_05410 [Chloroflexi bacterium]|nr:hypothetical protein [Chloroflexota bacterium]